MKHALFPHKPRALRLALGASLLALALTAHALPESQFEPAFATFLRASGGEEKAIDPAAEAFTALLKIEPTNPVLMAYAGAATALQAKTTLLPWKKMHSAEDGLALLDKALSSAAGEAPLQQGVPAWLEVRFVAASTFLAVPGFMNRAARGTALLKEVLSSPLFNSAPLPFRGSVWLTAAKQANAQGHKEEARDHLDSILRNKAPQAEAARAQLAKLGL